MGGIVLYGHTRSVLSTRGPADEPTIYALPRARRGVPGRASNESGGKKESRDASPHFGSVASQGTTGRVRFLPRRRPNRSVSLEMLVNRSATRAFRAHVPLRHASWAQEDERRWLLGLVLVTLCSWGRWLASGSLKVDESYPSALMGALLLIALSAGYGLLVLGWAGLLLHPIQNPRRLAFAGLAVAALMLPMLSNDVFNAFAFGSQAARGEDVYSAAGALQHSVWSPWIGAHWSDVVCASGPTTLLTLLPVALVGAHPLLALLVLRLTWFVPLVLVMELSFRRLSDRPSFHAMVWLNPLFLLEGPGQLHADLLGVVAITAGILFQQRGRLKTGWGAFSLAVLGKYTFVVTGAWFWLAGARTWKERAVRVPLIGGIVGALGAIAFAPFWRGSATLLEPARSLSRLNPGGTLTEFVGILVHVARGGAAPSPEMSAAEAFAMDRATHGATWFCLSLVLGLIVLRIAIHVFAAIIQNPKDEDVAALGTGILIVAFTTLAARRFEPWYLMAALPFFGLRCTNAWKRWWIAAVAAAVAPTFMNLLPRSAAILPVWSVVTTVGAMVVFVSSFKSRYLSLGVQESVDAIPAHVATASVDREAA